MATLDQLHELAGKGQEQLQEVVAVVRQLFAVLGFGKAGDAYSLQRQLELQQQYITAMASLKTTLTECCSLAAAQAASDARADTQVSPIEAPQAAAEALTARATQLQTELGLRNEVVKQLIDQLRQMLESMCMWESHRHALEKLKLAEGH
ncbi:hypothetical protein HYH03_013789 [Edaphochlamys debaryana]|uniref:Uncharacterized protein n=1 Tax=Edaphochlamys debaryana TaxID=47281 RepID=A0A835XMM1_9CHLO|nr:hypothetical protein HYH03_013789 [Edaphochlamys debaryana]|eukprot:KAG2487652.1 hypothetical protein HYH03_013789 [Edaphochlamys debaryana]